MPKTTFKSDFYEILHDNIRIQVLSETFFRFQVSLLDPILRYFFLWQLRKSYCIDDFCGLDFMMTIDRQDSHRFQQKLVG